MYKLFTQAQYDDNGTRRHLVNAVYTDDKQHPRLDTCEGVYDQDTNVKWWQCSTDELLCDDAEWCKITKSYGSVENYLKTQQTELEF